MFFFEEPIHGDGPARLELSKGPDHLLRVVPRVPHGTSAETDRSVRQLLEQLYREQQLSSPVHWYYTPMMLGAASGLPRSLTVYDCMDELANFLHAPTELQTRERQLMLEADVVFTGGHALYESKRTQHRNTHAMPSSVDVPFFARARLELPAPADQADIAHPRIGYCGVIDERIDLALLAHIARERPAWQLVMLGPVVKIDPASLPRPHNIHYLGLKRYEQLPSYLSGWDAAIMPFARNDATRFISPTKTPEYLAAGKPVVSTAIRDVIEPYGRLELVRIGHDHASFVAELDAALGARTPQLEDKRDAVLASMSWDATWAQMQQLMAEAWVAKTSAAMDDETQKSSANV